MNKAIEYGLASRQEPKKTRTGMLGVGGIGVILLGASVYITQRIASLFGFDPVLGNPVIGTYYAPFDWIKWYLDYRHQYPDELNAILKWAANLTVLAFGGFASIIYYSRKGVHDQHKNLHGSARFATFDDVNKMNLLDDHGIVLGSFQDTRGRTHILRHDGPEHVLMVAPTGSGKGVSVVNPTLLTWPHSMVVYDLKKENWGLSSKWRKEYAGNTVLRFEPACSDGTAASYNPLAEMRLNTDHDVQDAQNIAAIVLEHGDEGSGKSGGDTYFIDAAYGLLVAYILHTCYEQHQAGNLATLTDVAETLSDPNLDFESLLQRMKTTKHCHGAPHPLCMRQATSLLNMLGSGAGKQFAGIQGVVESKLSLYADPIVRKNITDSDFKVSDLMSRDKPVTLYICVGSTDKSRLKPLTKLLLTQIVRNLTKEVEFSLGAAAPTYKHKLLMLIDEFPSLGKMSIINEAIAFLRGYGIRCLLIIQDFNQLRSDEAYGRNEAITANCGVQIAFAPNIYPTADELAKKVGTTTVVKREVSASSGKKLFGGSSESKSIREISRLLLTPDEIMRMPTVRKEDGKTLPGDELVLIAGQPPIYGRQILHFEDPVLSKRAELGALLKSDVL